MKKTALVVAICALTLLIVLPVISSVKDTSSNTVLMDRALRADGDPMPPFPPPKPTASFSNTLVADGDPMPPFPPKPPSELGA